MATIEEFVNAVIKSGKNTMDFEKYCKEEGLSSIQIRKETYQQLSNKKRNLFKSIIVLIKKII